MLSKKLILDIISIALILNFFYEGIQKLVYLDFYGFWISHAPLIKNFGKMFKYLIPTTEIAIAALLMIPRYRGIALMGIIFMQMCLILWIMSVYLFTGYLFWPYHALWNSPTWMQKMMYSLIIAWLALFETPSSKKLHATQKNTVLHKEPV